MITKNKELLIAKEELDDNLRHSLTFAHDWMDYILFGLNKQVTDLTNDKNF